MSFGLVKLLSLLVYPLSGALFASVLALLLAVVGRRSLAWLVLVCAGGWLYLCSTAWFADRLQQPLEAMYPPQAVEHRYNHPPPKHTQHRCLMRR